MNYHEELHNIIRTKVFVSSAEEIIDHFTNAEHWLFDFRRVLMNGRVSHIIGELFYEHFAQEYPFQICSVEIAGVPLGTGLMRTLYDRGHRDVNAFFIRKSRKKAGLFRMIEGEIQKKKIILVDDLINRGNSLWKQIIVLEELGYQVDTVWAILRFRDLAYYKHFTDRGIKVETLFCLDDFTQSLGHNVHNIKKCENISPLPMPFKASWIFSSNNPNLGLVIPKSQPSIDGERIYVGSDSGTVWALNQIDGSVAWSHKTLLNACGKGTFSEPVCYKDMVITGGYNGNIVALNKNTGKRVWVNYDADFIGSSPAVNTKNGIIYCGMEFGLIGRRGGIIAIDANTGKTLWSDYTHKALTHASPLWIPPTNEVVIGSNEGVVYMYDARTGKCKWKQTTFGGAWYDAERDGGFGDGSIKMRPAFYNKKDYLIVNAIDGYLYVLERSTGNIVRHVRSNLACWSTPIIWNSYVFWTSEDKNIRCFNLDTLTHVWKKNLDGTRIFASPTIINDLLYVGTNAGRLHELNPQTGSKLGYFQAQERITNHVVYNPATDSYFLPTYANEIICLKKNKKAFKNNN